MQDVPKEFTNITSDYFTANKKALLEWLATPEYEREIKTLTALAGKLGVTRQTLHRWKNEREMVNAVLQRKKELAGVTGLPTVIDALAIRASRVNALDSQGNDRSAELREANEAAKLYMQWFYEQDLGDGTSLAVKQQQQQTTQQHNVTVREVLENVSETERRQLVRDIRAATRKSEGNGSTDRPAGMD